MGVIMSSGVTAEDLDNATKGTLSNTSVDAWNKQKVVTDFSLMHGMFTTSVPKDVWYEKFNGVELSTFTRATSVNGKLSLVSGTTANDTTYLRTFRNLRYEPNRGHIYSISAIFPNPTANGERDFGYFTEESGVFFRLKATGLYACVTTKINSVVSTIQQLITIPFDVDLSKGNIFDIQAQWRGVGNIKFFIGNPTTGVSELVHTISNLNSLTELSYWNPALPAAYRCKNISEQVTLYSGCVDISTEGGKNSDGVYGSIPITTNTGSVAVTGYNPLLLAVHNQSTFGGHINTRDVLNLSLTAYSDQKSVVRVWVTRDPTAITLGTQTWTPYRDGVIRSLQLNPAAGTPATFNTAKATIQYGSRINIDNPFITGATFDKETQIWVTPGDYIIFTIHRENGGAANAGVTYEFTEAI